MEEAEVYASYTTADNEPVAVRARRAFEALAGSGQAVLVPSGGGSDANDVNARYLRACGLGIGAENCHNLSERMSFSQLELLSRWMLRMVRS